MTAGMKSGGMMRHLVRVVGAPDRWLARHPVVHRAVIRTLIRWLAVLLVLCAIGLWLQFRGDCPPGICNLRIHR